MVARFALNPWLTVLRTGAGADALEDVSNEAQDGNTTIIDFSSFDTIANGDALYIGSHLPFRGVAVDIGTAAQGTATTLAVEYLSGAGKWATLTPTDGTASGGATFAVDGSVTWTVPSTATLWKPYALRDVIGAAGHEFYLVDPMYWTRWSTNTAFDTSVDVLQFRALNRSTAYAELVSGESIEELVTVGTGGVSCVEALTDAGTANLLIRCAAMEGRFI